MAGLNIRRDNGRKKRGDALDQRRLTPGLSKGLSGTHTMDTRTRWEKIGEGA